MIHFQIHHIENCKNLKIPASLLKRKWDRILVYHLRALISTIGTTPQVVTEVIDELEKRGEEIETCYLLPTTYKGVQLSASVLSLDFKYGRYDGKINLEKEELPFDDIRTPKNCKTFRNILQQVIGKALKHYPLAEVGVILAGGRKTMPIDGMLLSMANGIKSGNIFHIIAEGEPGVRNVFKEFNEKERDQILEYAKKKKEPPASLLKKIGKLCHPEGITTHLIRIPVPGLSKKQRKALKEELLP